MLLYLTLNRDEASEYSTCNQVEYQRISYKKDILPWLQSCIGIAALHPIVRETIRQYITNIKQITNIMSEENNDELIELLLKFKWWDRNIDEINRLIPTLTCSDLDKVKAEIKKQLG